MKAWWVDRRKQHRQVNDGRVYRISWRTMKRNTSATRWSKVNLEGLDRILQMQGKGRASLRVSVQTCRRHEGGFVRDRVDLICMKSLVPERACEGEQEQEQERDKRGRGSERAR